MEQSSDDWKRAVRNRGNVIEFSSNLFLLRARKYVVSLLGATESTKSARQAALNEHTSFRVIHASAGCPRASRPYATHVAACACVRACVFSDGNDDLATRSADTFHEKRSFLLDRQPTCLDQTIPDPRFGIHRLLRNPISAVLFGLANTTPISF